jgi:predicted nucleic acid-binding protein
MTALYFVDTNVLVYQNDVSNPRKKEAADEWMARLWREASGRVSYQVLIEYYANAVRLWPRDSLEQVRADIRDLWDWEPMPIDGQVIELAWDTQSRNGLSWWDSLIVAAADLSGCDHLLTEDLQDGQQIGPVRVVNPFTHDPAEGPA